MGAEADEVAGAVTGETAGRTTGASAAGGATRKTWPGSIKLALSNLFQRKMSRQLWPLSMPMRINVSPGLTV
jgi:hypothetical protein